MFTNAQRCTVGIRLRAVVYLVKIQLHYITTTYIKSRWHDNACASACNSVINEIWDKKLFLLYELTGIAEKLIYPSSKWFENFNTGPFERHFSMQRVCKCNNNIFDGINFTIFFLYKIVQFENSQSTLFSLPNRQTRNVFINCVITGYWGYAGC